MNIDWVNKPEGAKPPAARKYRLECEERLADGVTIIYTYVEVPDAIY